jgi:hypothetical protein
VPPARFATGSGIVTMARQLGIVLGVALLVTVLGSPSRATALADFGRSYVLTASLAATAGLSALLLVLSRRRASASAPVSAPAAREAQETQPAYATDPAASADPA